MITVRKARERDRDSIALCIAEGFEKDFSSLCKNSYLVAKAIKNGLNLHRFFVAELDNVIVGVLGVSDCDGRAMKTDKQMYIKHFGFLKGHMAFWVMRSEFEATLEYPHTTGYLECLAVDKKYRRKGIASELLKQSMIFAGYPEYVLDVTDVNITAFYCYKKLGFKEFKRIPEKHGKQKGFYEKIYMEYKNEFCF